METAQKIRIHPLAAGAAVAVIIASAVAVAAMTGYLPGSNATPNTAQQLEQLAAAPTAPVVAPPYVAPAPYVAPQPAVAPAPEYAPPPPAPVEQAAPSCPNCGVVQSVSAYQQKPERSVPGMIGGAVVGGLVGHQIGHGTTNTLATVGGAAGGAYLGNKIGQKVQTKTRYKVVVRLDSGKTRTFTYAAQPGFHEGSYVRVENGKLVSDSG
jgi:outer membrane lipoprotein SlyB